jgi:Uma2 family endonuclease
MGIGDPHMAALKRLVRFFKPIPDDRALLGIQDMIELADSLPEPDFTLLVPVADCYESRTAGPSDILLLVEIADSSLEYDQTIKLPLYAESGIREYWIVNLVDERIEVYRRPQPSGVYLDVQQFHRGQSITLVSLSDLSLPVEAVLGTAAAKP